VEPARRLIEAAVSGLAGALVLPPISSRPSTPPPTIALLGATSRTERSRWRRRNRRHRTRSAPRRTIGFVQIRALRSGADCCLPARCWRARRDLCFSSGRPAQLACGFAFQTSRLLTSESALRRCCVAASERPLIGRRGCCRSSKASVSSVAIGTLTSPATAVSPRLSASGNSSDVARGPHGNASRRAGDRTGGKRPIRATRCSPPGVA
jgi:hypothetical protein